MHSFFQRLNRLLYAITLMLFLILPFIDYLFNKNQLSLIIVFEIVDNAKIGINTTISRFKMPLSFENEEESV